MPTHSRRNSELCKSPVGTWRTEVSTPAKNSDSVPLPAPPLAPPVSRAQRRRSDFEKRERLVRRIERVVAARDRCQFWTCYTGRTREEHVTAVRLIRGGIDLDAAKIVSVLNDLPPESY